MTCELSYPSQLLRKDSPLFDEILTPQGKIDLTDPTKNIPAEKRIAGTNALNNAFNGIKNVVGPANYPYSAFADEFPTLADKLQTAPITQVEASLFSNDYGQDLDKVALEFNAYTPGTIPSQNFKDICTQLDQFYNKNMGAALSSGLCGAFPDIFGKLTQAIALVESVKGLIDDIKNFNPEDFISGLVAQIVGPLKAIAEAIKNTIDNLRKSLEKAAKQIADSVKDAAKDFKAAATKVINRIKKAVNKVLDFLKEPNMDKLKDSVEELVSGASSAFEKMDLKILALLMFRFCQLAGAVQEFMKKPLEGLAKLALTIKGTQAIMKSMSLEENKKAVEAGAVRISPDEKQTLKDDARTRMNASALSVEEIVRIARDAIENAEDKLVQEEPTIVVTELPAAETQPEPEVKVETVEGADVEPLERPIKQETNTEIEKEEQPPRKPHFDSGFDAVELRPYVTIMQPNAEQADALNKLATDKTITEGIPKYFTFDANMQKQTKRKDGVDTGEPGPAWMEVDSNVWLTLIEVKEQVTFDLIVWDGFNGGENKSSGQDVTLKITSLSMDQKIALFIAASRAGFQVIRLIGNLMFMSLAGGRSGYWTTSDPLAKDAVKLHNSNEWSTWRPAVQVK